MSATPSTQAAAVVRKPATNQKAPIVASMVGVLICLLDTNIVNVALPDIQRSLGGGLNDGQWIVSLYVLALAALIVPAGMLGDLIDIRVVFGVGAVIFGAGSVLCAATGVGSHHSVAVIFLGRVVQGAGAAFTLPLSLAMIFVYAEPAATRNLIALWSAVSGLSTAIGPLVGGLVVQHLGWTWIFLLNIPIVVLLLALLARTPAPTTRRREHLPAPLSTLSFAVATFAVTFAVIQAPSWGWGSPGVIALFALAAVSAIVFTRTEASATHPLVPASLRREPTFRESLVTGFVTGLTAFSLLFFLSYYLQFGSGLGPVATGLRFLPMSAMLVLVAGGGRRFSARIGPARAIGLGMVTSAVGLSLLWVVLRHPHPGTLATIAPTMVIGVGVGLSFPATSAQAFAHASAGEFGTAASVLTMSRQLGNSVGVGVLGLIMTHYAGRNLSADGIRQGLRWIGLSAAVVAAASGLFTLLGAARRASAPHREDDLHGS